MPIMDGYGALKEIKEKIAEGTWPDMTVVAQTAYEIEHEIKKIFKAGFTDCLFKPLTLQ